MTLTELFTNEALRQHEFPVTRDKIFLAHAFVSPLPRRVAEAVAHYALNATQGEPETLAPAYQLSETRALAARLLGAQPEEIAFVGPTSRALSCVAAGLPLRKHDNVLIYFDDYPSNVYPWLALAEKGVEVRLLNIRVPGRVRAIDVMGQVDENTRLVALSSAHFLSGFRLELPRLGEFLRARKIPFCLDGIQTVGAFPTPAAHVDFLAADAHKWLLGPCGAGLLYVRQAAQERLRPVEYGWNNVRSPNSIAQEQIVFRANAGRYEAGTHNLLGLVGLRAALELLLEIGVENIAAELLRKRAWLVPALQAQGWTVLHADAPPENASGITTIHRPDTDLPALHRQLEAANIFLSLRHDRAGQAYLRLAPHFYNTDAELHRVLERL